MQRDLNQTASAKPGAVHTHIGVTVVLLVVGMPCVGQDKLSSEKSAAELGLQSGEARTALTELRSKREVFTQAGEALDVARDEQLGKHLSVEQQAVLYERLKLPQAGVSILAAPRPNRATMAVFNTLPAALMREHGLTESAARDVQMDLGTYFTARRAQVNSWRAEEAAIVGRLSNTTEQKVLREASVAEVQEVKRDYRDPRLTKLMTDEQYRQFDQFRLQRSGEMNRIRERAGAAGTQGEVVAQRTPLAQLRTEQEFLSLLTSRIGLEPAAATAVVEILNGDMPDRHASVQQLRADKAAMEKLQITPKVAPVAPLLRSEKVRAQEDKTTAGEGGVRE